MSERLLRISSAGGCTAPSPIPPRVCGRQRPRVLDISSTLLDSASAQPVHSPYAWAICSVDGGHLKELWLGVLQSLVLGAMMPSESYNREATDRTHPTPRRQAGERYDTSRR